MRLRTVMLGTALFMLAACLPVLAQSPMAAVTATAKAPDTVWTMTLAMNDAGERVVTIERVVPWAIEDFSTIEIRQDYANGCYTLSSPPLVGSDVNCVNWFNGPTFELTASHPSYSESTANYSISVAAKGRKINVSVVLPEAFLSVLANFVQLSAHGERLDGSSADFSLSIPIMGLYYH